MFSNDVNLAKEAAELLIKAMNIKSNLFNNNEVEMLFKLRSRNLDFKSNFKTKFTFNNVEKLECPLRGCAEIDEQQHILKCKLIIDKLENPHLLSKFKYDNIFSDERKQSRITKLFIVLMEIRTDLLNKQQHQI